MAELCRDEESSGCDPEMLEKVPARGEALALRRPESSEHCEPSDSVETYFRSVGGVLLFPEPNGCMTRSSRTGSQPCCRMFQNLPLVAVQTVAIYRRRRYSQDGNAPLTLPHVSEGSSLDCKRFQWFRTFGVPATCPLALEVAAGKQKPTKEPLSEIDDAIVKTD